MTDVRCQPCILAPNGKLGRSLTYRCVQPAAVRDALTRMASTFHTSWGVLGFGEPLARALGETIAGLRTFPAPSGDGPTAPSTQEALWISLQADDRGSLFDRTRALDACLAPALARVDTVDTFTYRGGRDLTGYEDGTENPRFERVLRRMLRLEDGVLDALFSFSRPETGGYYFCPPCRGTTVDLRSIGL